MRRSNRIPVGASGRSSLGGFWWRMTGCLGAWLLGLSAAVAQTPGDDPPPPIPDRSAPRSSAPALDPGAGQPAEGGDDGELDTLARSPSTRFRLLERYHAPGEDAADGRIGAYKVAFWETITTTEEVPQAAPRRTDVKLLVKATEQPTIVAGPGRSVVTAMARRYDSFRLEPDPRARPSEGPPLTGRQLWIQKNKRGYPLVFALNELDRRMTEQEFRFTALQHPFVPDLSDLLPDQPVAVGGTWVIPESGAMALLGAGAVPVGGELHGKLMKVDPPAEAGGKSRATIAVAGRLNLGFSAAALNAQLVFEFPGERATGASPSRPANNNLVTAYGAIVRLSLAEQQVTRNARESRAPNATRTRQMVLERRLDLGNADSLNPPEVAPDPSVANSWVKTTDPSSRFSFDHPQDFRLASAATGPGEIRLMRDTPNPAGPDSLFIKFAPGDRYNEDEFQKTLIGGWSASQFDVSKGPAGWLPDADWPDRRVYRLELGVSGPGATADDEPVSWQVDGYLIRFRRDATAYVNSMTASTDPERFRREIEQIIRTITPETAAPAATGAPAGP